MGQMISGYVANFVKTGNPNGTGPAEWPQLAERSDTFMDFTDAGTAVARTGSCGREN
jgi:para-nitrobenzyl esterase